MVAAVESPRFPTVPEPAEQRMLLHVTWKEYVLLRDLLDGPGLRMTYLRGALELMSPSPITSSGRRTLRASWSTSPSCAASTCSATARPPSSARRSERGAEPDECYLVGHKLSDVPQIALEVIYTAPLLDKLDVYSAMGIAEVWVYESGTFRIWTLAGDRYEAREASTLIPALDFKLLARYVPREDTLQALRDFEREVKG